MPDVVPAQGNPFPFSPPCRAGWVCSSGLTSSVATGNKYQHKHEEETLLKEALGLNVGEPWRTTKGVQ